LPSTSGTVPLNNQTFYLGTTSVAINRSSANLALTGISSVAFPGSTSGTAILQATATAGTPTLSLPITTGTLISTGDSATVSNTMLANNSVTFGSTTVALGATSTSLAGLTSIDGTTGLTSAFATPNGTVALLGAATTLNFANTATTVSEYAAVTSLAIGNTATAAQTVNMFTASTGASTYNIATGATTNGTTKAINIGTGGVSGSTTNITIGSSNGGTTTVKGTLSFAGSTSGTVKFVAPATAGTASYTLPSAYPGTAGFALVSDLSGTLSWAAAGAVISTDTTDTVLYPTMTTLSSGNFTAAKVNTSFTYNATNGTLSATTLSGTLANSLTINGTVYNNSSAVSLTIPAGPTGPAGPSTYDLFQFVNGKPLATEVLMRAIAVRAYTIAANFAGCLAYCTTGAASAQTINILKNGATIGTITFAISSTSGTFAGSSSGVTMNIGDQLQVQMASGASQDSSFSDLAFTIKGTSS
jgi:hypothetical protein